MNLAFNFNDEAPVQFHLEPLTERETEVHARAVRQSEVFRKTEADLLVTIEELDQMNLFRKFGRRSTHDYNINELKLSVAVSLNFINVARKTREVPELQTAITRGDLSVSKARKIIPVINAENKEEWLGKAQTLSQAELEREVAEAAPEAAARLEERAKPKKGQRVEVKFSWPKEIHEKFKRAQDLVSDKNRKSASIEDTMTMALEALLSKIDPLQKAERSKMRNEKRQQTTPKKPEGNQTTHCSLSRDRLRRVKPENSKSESSTRATSAKRTSEDKMPNQRTPISAKLRHQINLRDKRKCQSILPDGSKCNSTRFLDFHHIEEVAKGGTNTLENLITLCGSCHRHWHGDAS